MRCLPPFSNPIMPLNFTLSQLTHRIQTPRLLIRLPQADDRADLFELHRDDAVNRYLPYASWKIPDDGNIWFERAHTRLHDNTGLQMVMVANDLQKVIGSCVLFHFELENEVAEIGYALAQAHWGKGYAAEAIQALIDYAFVVLGMRRLVAHVDVRNRASHQLLLKLGFTHEGVLREDSLMKGELTSANIYGLLRRDWEK